MKRGDGGFRLDLLEQTWLEPGSETDPCTHGRLRIVINGMVVMDGTSDDTSISKTALALSRTLSRDHLPSAPVAPQLVFHGCGFATMLEVSCGIGADWSVRHEGGTVRITDVVRFDGPSREPAVPFADAACVVPENLYRREVVRLASAALAFAAQSVKRIEDPYDLSEWLGWQDELRTTLGPRRRTPPGPTRRIG
jgi:hypothetical protein